MSTLASKIIARVLDELRGADPDAVTDDEIYAALDAAIATELDQAIREGAWLGDVIEAVSG